MKKTWKEVVIFSILYGIITGIFLDSSPWDFLVATYVAVYFNFREDQKIVSEGKGLGTAKNHLGSTLLGMFMFGFVIVVTQAITSTLLTNI